MKEETKASYDKEAYIKKKREQLDNAYKTIDEGLEEITTNPDFFKEYKVNLIYIHLEMLF